MTFANPVKAAEDLPVLSTKTFQPIPQSTSGVKRIFIGPNGLRAGSAASHLYVFVHRLAYFLCGTYRRELANHWAGRRGSS
jgi:hypothetical protein